MKKLICLSLLVLAVLWTAGPASAMMCGSEGHDSHQDATQSDTEHKHGTAAGAVHSPEKEAVYVSNKICPVSGEEVGQGMEPATYEYEGKIYNFCCAGCIDEFKKDPEKYIKKVEEELQAGPKEGAEK